MNSELVKINYNYIYSFIIFFSFNYYMAQSKKRYNKNRSINKKKKLNKRSRLLHGGAGQNKIECKQFEKLLDKHKLRDKKKEINTAICEEYYRILKIEDGINDALSKFKIKILEACPRHKSLKTAVEGAQSSYDEEFLGIGHSPSLEQALENVQEEYLSHLDEYIRKYLQAQIQEITKKQLDDFSKEFNSSMTNSIPTFRLREEQLSITGGGRAGRGAGAADVQPESLTKNRSINKKKKINKRSRLQRGSGSGYGWKKHIPYTKTRKQYKAFETVLCQDKIKEYTSEIETLKKDLTTFKENHKDSYFIEEISKAINKFWKDLADFFDSESKSESETPNSESGLTKFIAMGTDGIGITSTAMEELSSQLSKVVLELEDKFPNKNKGRIDHHLYPVEGASPGCAVKRSKNFVLDEAYDELFQLLNMRYPATLYPKYEWKRRENKQTLSKEDRRARYEYMNQLHNPFYTAPRADDDSESDSDSEFES
jgi:hypothetical protein